MIYAVRHTMTPIQARVTIPGSKSMTNRAFLLAAFSDGISEISNVLVSDDTLTFSQALHDLGIMIQLDQPNQCCLIGGAGGQFPRREATIWCHDAGTAARFLIAACAATPGVYHFDASEQLRKRPLDSLLTALTALGVKILPDQVKHMPLTLIGSDQLQGGEIELEGAVTGQYLSALLMVAPFAKKPLLIKTEKLVSQPYVDMTCDMMAEFGVLVRRLHQGRYLVPVPQRYRAQPYQIEPDLSTASYFFAAAAMTGGEIHIQPVNLEASKQGDAAFLKVLEKMGCRVSLTDKSLCVTGPKQLRGVNVDMRDFSDTFMTLAVLAPFAESPTTMTNIGHVRFKESNRITAMRTELEKCGIQVEEGKDWLKIYPSHAKGTLVDSHRDHRIAMSFAVLGLRVPNIQIDHAESVNKTCPNFFKLWEALYR